MDRKGYKLVARDTIIAGPVPKMDLMIRKEGTVNRVTWAKGMIWNLHHISTKILVRKPGKSHAKDRQLESALSSLILQRREG